MTHHRDDDEADWRYGELLDQVKELRFGMLVNFSLVQSFLLEANESCRIDN